MRARHLRYSSRFAAVPFLLLRASHSFKSSSSTILISGRAPAWSGGASGIGGGSRGGQEIRHRRRPFSVAMSSSSVQAPSGSEAPEPPTVFPPFFTDGVVSHVDMLPFREDRYEGVIVDHTQLPADPGDFQRVVQLSLDAWISSGKRGVWMKVPYEKATLIPVAKDLGFEFHHAEKEYLMMTFWIPDNENTLPPNASHQVGVGALVVNNAGDMLVVRERHGILRGTGIWKVPTGLLNVGEDIPLAACREVFEETGVSTEFESLLTMRHSHNHLFGKSDLFLLVKLKLTSDPAAMTPQASEIEACSWMPVDEFLSQEHFHAYPLYRKMNSIIKAHVLQAKAINSGQGQQQQQQEEEEEEEEEEGADRGRPLPELVGSLLETGHGKECMLYHARHACGEEE